MNEISPIGQGERIVCGCFGVTEAQIRTYFNSERASVEDFIAATGATTCCTSCVFDFDLILESIMTGAAVARGANRIKRPSAGNARRDVVDSGFLINSDGIKTIVRVDNAANPFDSDSKEFLTDYVWHLRVIDEAGQQRCRRSGRLEIGCALTVDLGAEPGCPERGWFWIWLDPQSRGYFGATRPQYALLGPDWVSTVHTQPHSLACREKAVVVQAQNNQYRAVVSLVNGLSTTAAQCDLILSPRDGGPEQRRSLILPPNGSCLSDIDSIFVGAASRHKIATLIVKSDQPTRKHIIKIQPSGQYSIDHFPNAR